MRQSVIDRWAFWLDQANVEFATNLRKAPLQPFLDRLARVDGVDQCLSLVDRPPHKIALAKAMMADKSKRSKEGFFFEHSTVSIVSMKS